MTRVPLLIVLVVLMASPVFSDQKERPARIDIVGYEGIELGGKIPSGDMWILESGKVSRTDTLSHDPPLLFMVSIEPYESKVAAITVYRSTLESDVLDAWDQLTGDLVEEYGEPDILVEQLEEHFRDMPHLYTSLHGDGAMRFVAVWEDEEGDQIAAITQPEYVRDSWCLQVAYSWHGWMASEGEDEK